MKELVGEMKHVACGKNRLPILVELPVCAQQIAIAADNIFSFRIPHDELLVAVVHSVELVYIHRFAGAPACRTEGDLPQTADFFHDVRCVVNSDDINFVMTFVGHTETLVWGKLTFQQFSADRFYNLFFHIGLFVFVLL